MMAWIRVGAAGSGESGRICMAFRKWNGQDSVFVFFFGFGCGGLLFCFAPDQPLFYSCAGKPFVGWLLVAGRQNPHPSEGCSSWPSSTNERQLLQIATRELMNLRSRDSRESILGVAPVATTFSVQEQHNRVPGGCQCPMPAVVEMPSGVFYSATIAMLSLDYCLDLDLVENLSVYLFHSWQYYKPEPPVSPVILGATTIFSMRSFSS